MLIVKQGGIKYHFLSLWCDTTWNWTLVSWIIGEHCNHYKKNIWLNLTETSNLLTLLSISSSLRMSLLDGKNLGRYHMFPKSFWSQLELSMQEQIEKGQTLWWILYIYINSWRKNKCKGNLQKKRILIEVKRRMLPRCTFI